MNILKLFLTFCALAAIFYFSMFGIIAIGVCTIVFFLVKYLCYRAKEHFINKFK